jgi:hypothetical protein
LNISEKFTVAGPSRYPWPRWNYPPPVLSENFRSCSHWAPCTSVWDYIRRRFRCSSKYGSWFRSFSVPAPTGQDSLRIRPCKTRLWNSIYYIIIWCKFRVKVFYFWKIIWNYRLEIYYIEIGFVIYHYVFCHC